MKMIFQDPISSLNPRRKVEDIIAEGLRIWKIGTEEEQQKKVDEMMLTVGLDPALQRGRRPYQFSGGQCQRISIARAVITDPKLIICDEPVSALDVSVQAQILNLLEDMKARYGLTLIFIAHDLAVVKNVSDRVDRDVPRQDLRGRPARRALQAARAPVHRGAARRDPGARPERPARRARAASRARSRRRSRRRRAAGSARAARRRRTSAPQEEPRDHRDPRPASSSRVTSRCAGRDAADAQRPAQRPRSRASARGSPSILWATMFLFTCVVPPAIVSARL